MNLKHKKICLVTDWLTNLGGGERVLAAIADLFPNAPIYTTVCDRSRIGNLSKRDIRTSWLQYIPWSQKKHQWLLPLMPRAIESLDVSEYDVVLSFSSAFAKSVKTKPYQTHICYIHTPIRYAWEPDFDPRIQNLPTILKPLVRQVLEWIRRWDYQTRHRPDLYIANSSTTAARTKSYYNLPSKVLYPPVETSDFNHKQRTSTTDDNAEICRFSEPCADFYLCVGRMVPYKKFPLLVETFQKLPHQKLVLIGQGPDFAKVQKLAEGYSNIILKGSLSRTQVVNHLQRAKAFLLPQLEDAGITQLEAFAAGTPVIAYRAGGVLDVMQENINGIFFDHQTPASLIKAIETFETKNWDRAKIPQTAKKFDTKKFQKKYLEIAQAFITKN